MPSGAINEQTDNLDYRSIDRDYAVSGQVDPAQLPAIAAAGFRSIICARPDDEDRGQPSFSAVAEAASAAGLKSAHVPVSGMVGQGTFMRFEEAMRDLPKPVLAYCRSGGRAASLYTMLKRG